MLSINSTLNDISIMNNLTKLSGTISAAMERISTGAKINKAKDDAANCAISTKMNTQLREFNQVSNNIQSGMSLINTAEGAINNMSNILSRLRTLSLQGANGTYSETERTALQQEANELTNELYRIKNSTEYNNIELFGIKENEEGPIVHHKTTTELDKEYGANKWEAIDSVDDLKKIKIGADSVDKVYVLTSDINLNSEEWEAIGTKSNSFKGTFDGNNYTISNLKIDKSDQENQGFFGYVNGATIKNVDIKNAQIKGSNQSGVLVGNLLNSTITNCNTSGSIKGSGKAGGLIGSAENLTLSDSSSSAKIEGRSNIGGLVGLAKRNINISNCFATGDISGTSQVGGFIGNVQESVTITNCYATGKVESTTEFVGGFSGYLKNAIVSNCYATGETIGNKYSGGFSGYAESNSDITNCRASGNVTGKDIDAAGFIASFTNSVISNCCATGDVSGTSQVGGFAGYTYTGSILNSYSSGNVSGESIVGGFIGKAYLPGEISNNISISNITRTSGTNTNFGSFFGGGGLDVTKNNYSLQQNFNFTGKNQGTHTTEVTQEYFNDLNNWKTLGDEYDYSTMPPSIKSLNPKKEFLQLCVGSNSSNDMIALDLKFELNKFKLNLSNLESSNESINKIDEYIKMLSSKQANLGAVANRLESNLEITENNKLNLNSSISIIKDSDIAQESMNLISAQILQQVSTSLFVSSRQSKNMALSLIQQTIG